MRFAISTAFQPVDHLPTLARAADELGYHSMAVPDHVVDLEELETPYPYTADGSRRWDFSAAWPDPWVLIGSLAAITTRLRFFTSVYVPAIRNPFQVAKSVGTAAVLSDNRVSLGVGIGWCREEFAFLEQDFSTRGKRTDEALALMAELWAPGWTSSRAVLHRPRLVMEPTPTEPDPGHRRRAVRRRLPPRGPPRRLGRRPLLVEEAARDRRSTGRTRAAVGAEGDFSVITALNDAFLPEHFALRVPAASPTAGRCRGRTTTGSTPRWSRRSRHGTLRTRGDHTAQRLTPEPEIKERLESRVSSRSRERVTVSSVAVLRTR